MVVMFFAECLCAAFGHFTRMGNCDRRFCHEIFVSVHFSSRRSDFMYGIHVAQTPLKQNYPNGGIL